MLCLGRARGKTPCAFLHLGVQCAQALLQQAARGTGVQAFWGTARGIQPWGGKGHQMHQRCLKGRIAHDVLCRLGLQPGSVVRVGGQGRRSGGPQFGTDALHHLAAVPQVAELLEHMDQGRLPGGVQVARGQGRQLAQGGAQAADADAQLVQLLFIVGPFSQVAGRAQDLLQALRHHGALQGQPGGQLLVLGGRGPGPAGRTAIGCGQQALAPFGLGHGAQIQPMPRGPLRGERCKARHGPGLELQLQLANGGLGLLGCAPVGHHPAGVQRQLDHGSLAGDVAGQPVHLGAIGLDEGAACGLQRLLQSRARHGATVQLRLGLGRAAFGGGAACDVVLLPVQRAIAQRLDGLHPLVALTPQAKRNAA